MNRIPVAFFRIAALQATCAASYRYGTAGTGTTLSAAPDAAEGEPCSAAAAGQPAPAARSSFSDRMSIEAGLSRLSLGFTSALQRFGFR